jgi:hypothetical protein
MHEGSICVQLGVFNICRLLAWPIVLGQKQDLQPDPVRNEKRKSNSDPQHCF